MDFYEKTFLAWETAKTEKCNSNISSKKKQTKQQQQQQKAKQKHTLQKILNVVSMFFTVQFFQMIF